MAAGAGALGVELGGAAIYHGELHQRPQLGEGVPADADAIDRGWQLVQRGVWLWLLILCLGLNFMLEHGGRLRKAALEYGIAEADWLDLSSGLAPWPFAVPDIPAGLGALPETDDGLEQAACEYYGTRRYCRWRVPRRRSSCCRVCVGPGRSACCRRVMPNMPKPGAAMATSCAKCWSRKSISSSTAWTCWWWSTRTTPPA
jgi:hypothetical protein